MLLSELAEKELIEMENGIRYGYLSETECIFDPKTGKILGFELIEPSRMPFHRKKSASLFIPWEEIYLIGEDRILFRKAFNTRRHYDG
ncbi:YlmC/YmxH family sporulation protein [Ureibacillus sp. FSL K6-8385]|mgnify:CR=1 FL=1|uniref:YlmC/YmxH family sporulation protein n=1 Tax=Ureibacillus terrenus TaxID=118246 RepID=A0A540V4J3_9BACL|nr:YlmC/YmxH family sporulation protein [Ureibacillus terrenus]MED3660452.1 YlmC/YmxH family sporulation protein [Ureibacillus terrenus]MED3762607.1 YlmC/YmxH family sporulation protein [Ureibacillus terrenus]TQE91670.1 YlmC/YmxH family sporulation protein [Ureibacillus terrenus]